MNKPMIVKAEIGQEITGLFSNRDRIDAVKPACSLANSGTWYCITHKKSFDNNMQKDMHISDNKKHQLAWICNEHGAEVPYWFSFWQTRIFHTLQ